MRTRLLDTDIPLRAAAILLVCLNHAFGDLPLHGGMILLMALSGFNIARFGMQGGSPKTTIRYILYLTLKILIPSFLLVLLFFAARQKFDLAELLFVRNWFTLDRIALFPTWYPQVFWQMMFAFGVFFSIPRLGGLFFRAPAFASIVVCLSLLILAVWQIQALGGEPPVEPKRNLPSLFIWSIALGWVCFFLKDGIRARWIAVALAFACTLVIYPPDKLIFWMLTLGMTAVVLLPQVRLPLALARITEILAQATFTIFLFHRPFYSAFGKLFSRITTNDYLQWVFGVVGSVFLWLVATSVLRAYRATDRALFPKQKAVNLPDVLKAQTVRV